MQFQSPTLLTADIKISPDYQNKYLFLEQKILTLVLPLLDGPHTITSELVKVGLLNNFGNPSIMASCSVWYDFDSVNKRLTLCADELVSEKSTYITTFLNGVSNPHYQYAHSINSYASHENLLWNPNTPLTPGLAEELQSLTQRVNKELLERAIDMNLTVVQLAPPPPLPAELYKQLCPVYHNDRFVEFYDESKSYGAEYTVGNLHSIYEGKATFAADFKYANVIGSTADPKHGVSSWIELWRTTYKVANPTNCSSYHFAGTPGGGEIKPEFNCRGHFVGGHVIEGENASVMPERSDDVFIIPICTAHNNTNKAYMMPVHDNRAIMLKNYFKSYKVAYTI